MPLIIGTYFFTTIYKEIKLKKEEEEEELKALK
jgi:hypothetical protein